MIKEKELTNSIIDYLSKYIWFEREWHIKNDPDKVIAYAMRYASEPDYKYLFALGKDRLRLVLKNAEAGWFDGRNWNWWHLLLDIEDVPPLPKRIIPQ